MAVMICQKSETKIIELYFTVLSPARIYFLTKNNGNVDISFQNYFFYLLKSLTTETRS